MGESKKPKHYEVMRSMFPEYIEASEALGKAAWEAGPLDGRTILLVQLGAAAAARSEGSVRSHVRRALSEGASPEDIRHAIVALTSTIGFPQVAAALAWAEKDLTD
jgi:alkylhydroperoxidase/carboxymuconolactone decarboxylase family protein YurZ